MKLDAYGTIQNGNLKMFAARKPDLKPLKPNQKIRVIVDGEAIGCRVKDIRSRNLFVVIEEINKIRASGRPCIGFGTTYPRRDSSNSTVNIQIDVEQSPR